MAKRTVAEDVAWMCAQLAGRRGRPTATISSQPANMLVLPALPRTGQMSLENPLGIACPAKTTLREAGSSST
jgi:hypothetical protein